MDSAKLIVHKNGETAVYGLQSRSVLGSFGVVLMSCKLVDFHVACFAEFNVSTCF